jgi:hypothetical protein
MAKQSTEAWPLLTVATVKAIRPGPFARSVPTGRFNLARSSTRLQVTPLKGDTT